MDHYVLGIDVGTSAAKAMVLDAGGHVVGRGRAEYPLSASDGERVEQDPEDWWRGAAAAVRQACRDLDAGRITAMSLSTQGATSCLFGADGHALCPAITWMDRRALGQRDALAGAMGEEYFYRRTGWRLHPSLDAAKAAWLAANAAGTVAAAAVFASTLEYMNRRLCGEWVIDPTNAAIRQLLNLERMDWDDGVLARVDFPRAKLPPIRPSGALVGRLLPSAADGLGLPAEVRVFNGAHDQYCAALGAGLTRPGDLLLATGSTWVIFGLSATPPYSRSYVAPGPHIVPGVWGGIASLPGSGSALGWLRDNVIGGDFELISSRAAGRRERAKGLQFYPYLAGALFPFWDYGAKASLVGLDFSHDKYDIALAVMEGVAFHMRASLGEFAAAGCRADRTIVTGGAARSGVWLEIIAANLPGAVRVADEPDSSCLGAAMLAGVGAGMFADFEAAAAVAGSRTLPPADAAARAFYDEKYARHVAARPVGGPAPGREG